MISVLNRGLHYKFHIINSMFNQFMRSHSMATPLRFPKIFILLTFFLTASASGVYAESELLDLIYKADQAYTQNEYKEAEKLYTKAVELDSGNYRTLKALAELKMRFGKWEKANELIEKVLAMPVARGKNVLIFEKGSTEGQEGEIVDETVITPPQGRNNMRNYLEGKSRDPIPHYRLFFKKSGKVFLVPKSEVTLKFQGVPQRDYFLVKDMELKVKRILLAKDDSKKKDEMVAIKGGCFIMGNDLGHVDERPAHEVCIKDFKMDKYEVSQKAFIDVMGTNPSQRINGKLPVDSVTWFEADAYCKEQGKRLPTEAEWEYAAHAGTKTRYATGDKFTGKDGNFCDSTCTLNIAHPTETDGYAFTAPVGSFPANPFGLHDMSGNVAEWTNDYMIENYYQLRVKDNPPGPPAGETKVVRGGAWNTDLYTVQPSSRVSFVRDFRNEAIGFRCVSDK